MDMSSLHALGILVAVAVCTAISVPFQDNRIAYEFTMPPNLTVKEACVAWKVDSPNKKWWFDTVTEPEQPGGLPYSNLGTESDQILFITSTGSQTEQGSKKGRLKLGYISISNSYDGYPLKERLFRKRKKVVAIPISCKELRTLMANVVLPKQS